MKRACDSCGTITKFGRYCANCSPTPRIRGSQGQKLRHEVLNRDVYQCTAILDNGQRCQSTDRLEVDHIIPLGIAGSNNQPDNLRTLCHTHHAQITRTSPNFQHAKEHKNGSRW